MQKAIAAFLYYSCSAFLQEALSHEYLQAASEIPWGFGCHQLKLPINSGKSCTFTADHETLCNKLAQVCTKAL